MLNHKEDAELLRLGVVVGSRPVADAVRWADGIIDTDAAPPTEVIDVALAGKRSREEVAALLARVPGASDFVAVRRRWLGDLLRFIQREPDRADEVARWLYELSVSGELPDDSFGVEPNALDDVFDLARRTIVPREEAVRQLTAYLRRVSRPAT